MKEPNIFSVLYFYDPFIIVATNTSGNLVILSLYSINL